MIFLSRIKSLVEGPEFRAPRIAVFGDSHSVALKRAQQYTKRSHEYDHIDVRRVRKDKEGKAVGDTSLAEFCRRIAEFDDRDLVFSAIGGNQYAIVSTVQQEVDYDFLDASSNELNSGAQLVPFRALTSFIESGIRETIGPVLEEIRSSTSAKVFHLVPPPPKQDNAFVASTTEGYFERAGLKQLGPTRPELRLKCWKVQVDCLARLCQELGIGLVLPPSKTVTPNGYLEPSCYAKDVTHANRRYGEAVLRQIIRVASGGWPREVKLR
jgi:GGDEF domain-containing protein